MSDEPESLILRILREIQATQTRHTEQLAFLIDSARLQGKRVSAPTQLEPWQVESVDLARV